MHFKLELFDARAAQIPFDHHVPLFRWSCGPALWFDRNSGAATFLAAPHPCARKEGPEAHTQGLFLITIYYISYLLLNREDGKVRARHNPRRMARSIGVERKSLSAQVAEVVEQSSQDEEAPRRHRLPHAVRPKASAGSSPAQPRRSRGSSAVPDR